MSGCKDKVFKSAVEALVYFTDCEIATYNRLMMVKRSPQSEKRRHRDIIECLIENCRRFGAGLKDVERLDQRFRYFEKNLGVQQ